MVEEEEFFLQIGSMEFNKKAIGNLLFGFFFIGLLAGVYSMVHIQNPAVPFAATLPILLGIVIPAYFITKGIREVTVKEQQEEKVKVPQPSGTKTLSETIDSSAEVNAI